MRWKVSVPDRRVGKRRLEKGQRAYRGRGDSLQWIEACKCALRAYRFRGEHGRARSKERQGERERRKREPESVVSKGKQVFIVRKTEMEQWARARRRQPEGWKTEAPG